MIENLITLASDLPNCIVHPVVGTPLLEQVHQLPEDLMTFYSVCGGMELFVDSEYKITIVPPSKFVLANPLIVGELCEDDISSNWYTVAQYDNNEFISIDLYEGRLGKCYDSFHETHGLVGETPVISLSFTELLSKLISLKGESYFWVDENFTPYGDAYDILI